MSRRTLREHTLKLLFLTNFHEPQDYEEQYFLYLEDANLKNDEEEYVLNKTKDIVIHFGDLDKNIERISDNWKISRIGRIELSVLRLAIYEILYEDSIPKNVSISEAVEISKKYGGENSGSFINGILAKM